MPSIAASRPKFADVGRRSTFDLDRFLDWRESVRSRALPRQTSFAEGAS